MTKLHIAADLALPSDVVTATTVVYGGKGMGKTNLGSVIVEEATKAGLRWSLLDPMGVAWGLRHSKDGKGPSAVQCVILGGVHGDIPIEPTAGGIVADLVVDENVNTIIDFSRKPSGEMWSKGDKIKFVTEYANRLFGRQGQLIDGRRREPILQILDEAARYIPQIIPAKSFQLAECVGAWEQIAEEGRNIGLGVCFLTQRSARMNKSVSELADVMFAFRTIGPNSLAAIMDWLGEHVEKSHVRELSSRVRELAVGEALLVSPGWLKVEKVVHIRERETFDSSATPKPGQQGRKVTGKAAKPDLAKYYQRMAATIEKAKAEDPKELQRQIAERDRTIRELEKAPTKARTTEKAVVDQAAIERAVRQATARLKKTLEAAMKFIINISTQNFDVAGVDKEELERAVGAAVTKAVGLVDQRLEARSRNMEKLRNDAQRISATLKEALGVQDVEVSVNVSKNEPFTVAPRRPEPARPTRQSSSSNGSVPLAKGEKIVLTAIAQYPEGADRNQLTVLTGYKRSTRDAYIQRLSGAGFVEADGSRVVATPAGIDALGDDYEPLPEGEDLQNYWLDRLPEGERRILETLLPAYPESVRREQLEELTGFKRSTRDAYIQRLRSRRLVEDVGRSEVRASENLFSGAGR